MEVFVGYLTIGLGLAFAVHRWRKFGLADAPFWFVISSMMLINVGFLVNAVETDGGADGWALEGLLVVSGGLLMFIIGAFLGSQKQVPNLSARTVLVTERVATQRLIWIALLTFLPSWLYFYLLGYVPLFQGVDAVVNSGIDGLGALQASRLSRDGYASASGVLIPGQGLMQLMRNIGVPITAAYALAQMLAYRFNALRAIVLGLAVLTVLMAGQRWPLLYLCVALVAGLGLSGRRIRTRRVFGVLATVLVIGVIMSLLQRRTLETFTSWGDAVRFAVDNLFNRIFFEQSLVPIMSYETHAFAAGSLGGRSYWDSLMAYGPGANVSFPVEFFKTVTGSRYSYTAAPDFYTEAYINFGAFGVILLPLIWGVCLAVVSRSTFCRDRTLNAGISAGVTAILAQSCFTGPIFTIGGLAIAVALLWIVSFVVPARYADAVGIDS